MRLIARGVADASALAAADAAAGRIEADPCELAATVVSAAKAELEQCVLDADTGQVRVIVRVDTPLSMLHGRARAGPT